MKVLQHQRTEMNRTIRDVVEKTPGIVLEVVMEPSRTALGEFSFSSAHIGLWRYKRPSNGEYVWLIEVDSFAPPDAGWFETWVVDEEPTMQQMVEIASRQLVVGDEL